MTKHGKTIIVAAIGTAFGFMSLWAPEENGQGMICISMLLFFIGLPIAMMVDAA